MAMWNPWRGCHRISEGCKFCYIHKGDAKHQMDTDEIKLTKGMDAPILKDKNGEYRMKSGQTVNLCFSSDFFIEEADPWREECWKIIKERPDLQFLFLTKRIHRFWDCIPEDWGSGYENVTIGCTVENQKQADKRLSFFADLPIPHKNIICQPLLESIDIYPYLKGVELVVAGGESDTHGRPLNYDWILSLHNQCVTAKVDFEFRQCGTNFIKSEKHYRLKTRDLCAQARRANINYKAK